MQIYSSNCVSECIYVCVSNIAQHLICKNIYSDKLEENLSYSVV